jgi:uncharacterized paraquat-inducible protein A
MPWCDACDRYLSPNTLDEQGRCPTCGEPADHPRIERSAGSSIPWHFWVLVAALVAYLGWRLVEGVVWLAGAL